MNGLAVAWQEEINFRIQLGLAALVVVVGFLLEFVLIEWIIVTGCITAVLAAELVNTAIEDLCDKVEPAEDPIIGKIKDVMAGFVFVVSLGALIIGAFIIRTHI